MKLLHFFIGLLLFQNTCGQTFWQCDTIPNKTKTWLVATSSVGIIGGLYTYTGLSWYSNIPKNHFHFFNDLEEWKQMDKVGHAWTAYQESRMVDGMLRWAGHSRKTRMWIAGLSGFVFQAPLEVFDGFTEKWGASVTDLVANGLGSALTFANIGIWDEHRIQLKYSFHRTEFADWYPDLFGKGFQSSFKDYNGQTYWLSIRIHSFLSEKLQNRYPRWLNLSLGYGAQGLQGGYGKIDKNIIKNREFRQWYLAPDIDFDNIKTNKKWLKVLLFTLNCVHFPLPALEWNKHFIKFYFVYF